MEILFVSADKEIRDVIGSFLEQRGHILRFVHKDRVSCYLDQASYPLVIVDGSSNTDLALSICRMVHHVAQANETFLLMLAVDGEGKGPQSCLEAGVNDIWVLPMSSRLLSLRWRILEKCLKEREQWARQEERLQALNLAVESMQLGVTVTDQSGHILYSNPAEAEMHGYSVNELLGRDASHFGQPGIRRPATPDEMRAMGSWKRESINVRKDGSSFAVQLLSDVVRSASGTPIGIVTTCEDITARKKREEELRQSEHRFRMVAEEAPVMLWMNLNNEELFTHRWLNLTGRLLQEQAEGTWEDSIHPEDLPTCLEAYSAALQDHRSFELEYRFRTGNDECRWMLDHGSPWHLPDGSFAGYIGSCIDITHRKKAQERLEYDAFHDALTGLPNRALFLDRLEGAIRRGYRRDPRCAVLFVDLDDFKRVNDRMGHATGDFLLREVAFRLKKCLRPGDTVARIGGDEFTILLEDIMNISEACRITERILHELSSPVHVDLADLPCGASLGLVFSSSGYKDAESMLRDADTAMYRAKANGGARYVIFDEAMQTVAQQSRKLEADLRLALERAEFHLQYQPIIDMKSRRIKGLEALLRWRHPERGLLSPSEFLELAEQSDLIITLERWVINEACRQLVAWKEAFSGLPPLSVTVNISARHFGCPSFIISIREIVHRYGLDKGCLVLDIPESVILRDLETSASVLTQLKTLGVNISVEDFGVGNTSLRNLFYFPIDSLKVDRTLISAMDGNGMVIQNLILLAHGMKLGVVAEGVETTEQLDRLLSLDCEQAQGFLFSAPIEPDSVALVLKEQSQRTS